MFYSDCKKVDHVKATSKTWTQTLDPDPEKPGLRKTWTLKNLDYEKRGKQLDAKKKKKKLEDRMV